MPLHKYQAQEYETYSVISDSSLNSSEQGQIVIKGVLSRESGCIVEKRRRLRLKEDRSTRKTIGGELSAGNLHYCI